MTNLIDLKGFGKKRIEDLSEVGINTPQDLVTHFPVKYLDFTNLDRFEREEGLNLRLKGTLIEDAKTVFFKGLNYVIGTFKDETSGNSFKAVWYNQPFMKNNLKCGETYFLIGKTNSKKQLVVTSYFLGSKVDSGLVPVYKSGFPISKALIQSGVKEYLEREDIASVLDDSGLTDITLKSAYSELHFPKSIDDLENAQERITLENLAYFATIEKKIKEDSSGKNRTYNLDSILDFKALLPFDLTEDQETCLDEILSDLNSTRQMNRLVLGDVGSGKTMVAFGAIFVAVKSGYSAILLCPTEILAKQHFESAYKIFNKAGIDVSLYHSRLTSEEKKEVLSKVDKGEINLLIATHAVLSDKLKMKYLGLVITDEQHRFGVNQRGALSHKGEALDQLVMSATPIPRSLALVLFGGLDVSEIKSRPNGESRIKTKVVSTKKEKDMWEFIKKEVNDNNGKCFVIASRINSIDETPEILSVYDLEKRLLQFGFTEDEVKVVHGKTDPTIRDLAIEDFKSGRIKVLISTTIVEVGIDVKEANLMVIYNAERFGLATLHQLRGRIGRDGRSGFCFLVPTIQDNTVSERLTTFKNTNSGLKLAEVDLKMRGSGTLYGTNQHGANELFSRLNFSLEAYEKAKVIVNKLSGENFDILYNEAKSKFKDMYTNIVLN